MDDLVQDVFYHLMESDRRCAAASHAAAKRAHPLYEKLVNALGQEEGEKIWGAALQVGAAEAPPAFRVGLRFGLWLLVTYLSD